MKFSELVRLLEQNGFKLIREKGSIRYYAKPGVDRLIRVDYHGAKEIPTGTCNAILKAARFERKIRRDIVIDLKYSLVIEATEDPTFFGFYSPDLEGFTGVGHSIEDCLYQAKWGMEEHVELLKEQSLPIPPQNHDPKIVIQNQESLARAS
jgi:predicted RNA binding protein YcfA (HicA-like mRNA interferase family)/predicted RNase H-like HicB family nuclease